MIDTGTLIQVGTIIAAGGAAWGGVRQAMNGTRESVKEIKTDLKGHIEDAGKKHTQVCERLTAVETKLEK